MNKVTQLLRGYHIALQNYEKSIGAVADVFGQMNRDGVYCSMPEDYNCFDDILDKIDIQYTEAIKNIKEI